MILSQAMQMPLDADIKSLTIELEVV